jgi:hypothetical protein
MRPSTAILPFLMAASAIAGETVVCWESPVSAPYRMESFLGDYFMIPGASNSGTPGDPSLPVVPVRIILPAGAVADSVTVLYSEETALPGSFDIKPIQAGVPLCMPEAWAETPRNPRSYLSDAAHPQVRLEGQGVLMGLNIAEVTIRPVAWDPVSGSASFAGSMTIAVHHHAGVPVPAPTGRGEEGIRVLMDMASALTLNPDCAISCLPPAIASSDLPWGEYLIVTTASLAPSFEPLAEHKTLLGIPAVIVTMETIAAQYSGIDAAQDLRFFLRDIYDGTPPTYILLAGDTPLVPHRNCWATAEGYVDNPAADIYYQDMNDTAPGVDLWDANGNGTWGEIGGDVMDYYPDYLIGRASVQTPAEAALFVSKVLAFENPSINDVRDTDPWYTSMGFTTGILWTSPFCPGSAGKEKVDTLYTPPAWQPVVKHYDDAGTQSYAATMGMLNAGMQLVNHAGHGSETLVSIGTDYLQSSDFMGLTNISAHGRVSIWDTIACLSGAFDTGTCLAEAWIRSPNGGGFCMMNTRYGWGEPSEPGGQWSDLVDQEFFAKFFTEDLYHLGAAHAAAWSEFIPLVSSDTHYDWIAKSLTLFGDPELPMWIEPPDGPLQIDAPDHIVPGPGQVDVTVSDASGPVEDARVCLMQGAWDAPESYEVAYTDAAGQVSVNVDVASEISVVMLTAWARNHAAVTVEVPVSYTGIASGEHPADGVRLLASPNPSSTAISLAWSSAPGATIRILDLSGRIVAIPCEGSPETTGALVWDLRAGEGGRVPSGVYFAVLDSPGQSQVTRRLVVLER